MTFEPVGRNKVLVLASRKLYLRCIIAYVLVVPRHRSFLLGFSLNLAIKTVLVSCKGQRARLRSKLARMSVYVLPKTSHTIQSTDTPLC